MQTAYQIGEGNAAEALDQAAGLMAREPDYYRSIGDVLESYSENMRQTEGVTHENVAEAERGFVAVLERAGIAYRPYGM